MTTTIEAPKIPVATKTLETRLKARVQELLKSENNNRLGENTIAVGCAIWMNSMIRVFPTTTEESLRTLLKNVLGVSGKRITSWVNGGRYIAEYKLDPKKIHLNAVIALKNIQQTCTETSFETALSKCANGATQADVVKYGILKPAAVKAKIRRKVTNLNLTSKTKFITSLGAHMDYAKLLYGEGCRVTVTDARGEIIFRG